MKNLISKSLPFFIIFLLSVSKISYSQYDTTHYIPYLGDFTGNSKMTNLEYENTFGGAYFMFSTFESGPVNVKYIEEIVQGLIGSHLIFTLQMYPQEVLRHGL